MDGPRIIGYLIREFSDSTWDDARQLPDVRDGLQYHRVGTGYLDGAPIATGALWIVETNADDAILLNAIRKTMPGGTLFRKVPLT